MSSMIDNNTKIVSLPRKMENYIALFAVSIENLKNKKCHTF